MARGAQGRLVGRGQERERLGVVLDLAADRDEDRLVGLDRADDVVARDVGRGDDDDRRPVEGRVEVERGEPRVRIGRADRRAEPGAREDQVVGVFRGAGQLGRTLAPQRAAPRARPGAIVPGWMMTASGDSVRLVRSGKGRPPWRLTLSPAVASPDVLVAFVTGPHRTPAAGDCQHHQLVRGASGLLPGPRGRPLCSASEAQIALRHRHPNGEMTDRILYLLAILVAANVLLIGVALARSVIRGRRAKRERRCLRQARPSDRSTPAAALRWPTGPAAARGAVAGPTRSRGCSRRPSGTASLIDEAARIDRYGRPATVVIIQLDGLERLTGVLGPRRPRPHPAGAGGRPRPAGPRLRPCRPHSGPVASGSCSRRPARSRRSTTSSASARRASSGSNWARSRCAWPSAGPLRRSRGASPTPSTLAQDRMFTELRRGQRSATDLAPSAAASTHDSGARPPRPDARPASVSRRPVAQGPTGHRAGVDSVGHHQRAGHDDLLDADRIATSARRTSRSSAPSPGRRRRGRPPPHRG